MILKASLLATVAVLAINAHDPLTELVIGAPMPAADKVMKNVMGGDKSLSAIKGENGLLVVFSCNTCPFVVGDGDSEGWEGRYPELGVFARKHGVGMALVNSNEAKRGDGDSFADMQARYKEHKYNSAYLLDEGHKVADAFGARTTPHVFLFDKSMKLVYKGAIDDNVANASLVKEHWLQRAIDNMASGKPVDPATTRNIGCSIKRVAHTH